MRTFISLLLCYCGLIIIIASIIENRWQTSSYGSVSYRIKNILKFTLFGLAIIFMGWAVWPNARENNIPRYYIGKVLKNRTACKLYVRIKRKLDSQELRLIVSEIKQDSNLKNVQIAFFLLGDNRPYAYCNTLDDGNLWQSIVSKVSNQPASDFKIIIVPGT